MFEKSLNIGNNNKDGFAIALAWPDTLCKQAGAWYDGFVSFLGINREGYYKVGHAAVVLIDKETQSCRYFDFGRYHAPHGFGRVRSDETDDDLKMSLRAVISADGQQVINIEEILKELHNRPSTHGSGQIYGSYTSIDYQRSLSQILRMQKQTFIPYGPFLPNGTNCSRFVNTAVLSGKPSLYDRLKLMVPLTVSPTPKWNVMAIGKEVYRFGGPVKQLNNIADQPKFQAVYS